MRPAKTVRFNLLTRKAQALSELAIFGSILLFCMATLVQYGLDSNYQQQVQMEAFRKAQRIAYYKTGPGSAATVILLKDRPMVDPKDSWGFADRVPYGGSGSVTWDNNLSAEYVKHFDDPVNLTDMPITYFDVDHINSTQLTGLKTANAVPPTAAGQNNMFGFYTSRADKSDCPAGGVKIAKYDPTHTKSGTEYYSEVVQCSAITVMRLEGNETSTASTLIMYPFYRDDQLVLHRITSADVNGDDKQESILGAQNNSGTIKFYYLTTHSDKQSIAGVTQAGTNIQLDGEYNGVSPGERVWDPATNTWRYRRMSEKQGLLGDMQRTVAHSNSKITRDENKGPSMSVTNLNATQTITHKIRFNKKEGQINNEVLDIKTEYPAPSGNLYNW
jgi:hypothetical protein